MGEVPPDFSRLRELGAEPRPRSVTVEPVAVAAWAVTIEGRADAAAILLLIDDRAEAESIAGEICRRGTPVVVRRYDRRSQPAQQAVGPPRSVILQ